MAFKFNLPGSIRVSNDAPVDDRMVVADNTERDALISSGRAYEGMTIWHIADSKKYTLTDLGLQTWTENPLVASGITDAPNNGNPYVRRNLGWELGSDHFAPLSGSANYWKTSGTTATTAAVTIDIATGGTLIYEGDGGTSSRIALGDSAATRLNEVDIWTDRFRVRSGTGGTPVEELEVDSFGNGVTVHTKLNLAYVPTAGDGVDSFLMRDTTGEVREFSTTNTPDSTTFLRGDGQWISPALGQYWNTAGTTTLTGSSTIVSAQGSGHNIILKHELNAGNAEEYQLVIAPSGAVLGYVDFFGLGVESKLQITSAAMTVTDSTNSKGLVYAGDYSAAGALDPRWLPDKGYNDATYAPISGGGNYWKTAGSTTLSGDVTFAGASSVIIDADSGADTAELYLSSTGGASALVFGQGTGGQNYLTVNSLGVQAQIQSSTGTNTQSVQFLMDGFEVSAHSAVTDFDVRYTGINSVLYSGIDAFGSSYQVNGFNTIWLDAGTNTGNGQNGRVRILAGREEIGGLGVQKGEPYIIVENAPGGGTVSAGPYIDMYAANKYIDIGNWNNTSTPTAGGKFRIDGDDAFPTGTTFTDYDPSPTGIKYAADYSLTYDTRSLIDKGYADGAYWKISGTTTLGTSTTVNTSSGQGLNITAVGASSALYLNGGTGGGASTITISNDLTTGADSYIGMANGSLLFSIDENNVLGQKAGMYFQDGRVGAAAVGVEYFADYSANFTTRSLIDKGYADATYAPISGGGYVEKNTVNSLSGTATTGLIMGSGIGGILVLNGVQNTGLRIAHDGSTGTTNSVVLYDDVTELRMDNNNIFGGGAGSYFIDNRVGAAAVGLEYAADYSSNFTTRSLVDKAYVDANTGAFGADVNTQISPVTPVVLDQTSGAEYVLNLSYTLNKAAGDASLIYADITETTHADKIYWNNFYYETVQEFNIYRAVISGDTHINNNGGAIHLESEDLLFDQGRVTVNSVFSTGNAVQVVGGARQTDTPTRSIAIVGQRAYTSAVTWVDGGDVTIDGGAAVGSGVEGNVVLASLYGAVEMQGDYVEYEGKTAPGNPAAGWGRTWFDSTEESLKLKDDTGAVWRLDGRASVSTGVAIGPDVDAPAQSIVIGQNSSMGTGNTQGVVIGYNADNTATTATWGGVTIGYNAQNSERGVAIGHSAVAGNSANALSIGLEAGNTTGGINIGRRAGAGAGTKAASAVIVGHLSGDGTTVGGSAAIFGISSHAVANNAAAIGNNLKTNAAHATTVGMRSIAAPADADGNNIDNSVAFHSGNIEWPTIYEVNIGTLRTTGNTITTLGDITFQGSSGALVELYVVGREEATDGEYKMFKAMLALDITTAVQIRNQTIVYDFSTDAGLDVTIEVSSFALRTRVTGLTATNISWSGTARVNLVKEIGA